MSIQQNPNLTELERELLEALKDAYPYIADDSARHAAGNLIMRAEAKAKQPQCEWCAMVAPNKCAACFVRAGGEG